MHDAKPLRAAVAVIAALLAVCRIALADCDPCGWWRELLTSQAMQAAGIPQDTANGIDAGLSLGGAMATGLALRAGGSWSEVGSTAAIEDYGSPSPSTPVGRIGSPISVQPGFNKPTVINGRTYTGHALDRMQERGLTPTVIESTIRDTVPVPSRNAILIYHANGVKVIVNETGDVVTAMPQ